MAKKSVQLWLPQLQDSDKPGPSYSQNILKECSVVSSCYDIFCHLNHCPAE